MRPQSGPWTTKAIVFLLWRSGLLGKGHSWGVALRFFGQSWTSLIKKTVTFMRSFSKNMTKFYLDMETDVRLNAEFNIKSAIEKVLEYQQASFNAHLSSCWIPLVQENSVFIWFALNWFIQQTKPLGQLQCCCQSFPSYRSKEIRETRFLALIFSLIVGVNNSDCISGASSQRKFSLHRTG